MTILIFGYLQLCVCSENLHVAHSAPYIWSEWNVWNIRHRVAEAVTPRCKWTRRSWKRNSETAKRARGLATQNQVRNIHEKWPLLTGTLCYLITLHDVPFCIVRHSSWQITPTDFFTLGISWPIHHASVRSLNEIATGEGTTPNSVAVVLSPMAFLHSHSHHHDAVPTILFHSHSQIHSLLFRSRPYPCNTLTHITMTFLPTSPWHSSPHFYDTLTHIAVSFSPIFPRHFHPHSMPFSHLYHAFTHNTMTFSPTSMLQGLPQAAHLKLTSLEMNGPAVIFPEIVIYHGTHRQPWTDSDTLFQLDAASE